MKHLKLILSILFIFCLTRTYADDSNYLFRHYQVENGLSDNMATCCVQDRKGYIWIGTRDTKSRWILHLDAEIETQEEKTNEYAR